MTGQAYEERVRADSASGDLPGHSRAMHVILKTGLTCLAALFFLGFSLDIYRSSERFLEPIIGNPLIAAHTTDENSNLQTFEAVPLLPELEVASSALLPGEILPSFYVQAIIADASEITGICPHLLTAVMYVESRFNHRAVSPKGALGLMQVLPGNLKRYGLKDPFHPRDNAMAGAQFLQELLKRFGDERLALAAYNAGPQAVSRHRGVPPYRETRDFVREVLRLRGNYSRG